MCETEKKFFPSRDSDLTTVQDITERMRSIQMQIDKLEASETSASVRLAQVKHKKIAKLNSRFDILWGARAALLKAQPGR